MNIRQLFNSLDKDKNNVLDIEEFSNFIMKISDSVN